MIIMIIIIIIHKVTFNLHVYNVRLECLDNTGYNHAVVRSKFSVFHVIEKFPRDKWVVKWFSPKVLVPSENCEQR